MAEQTFDEWMSSEHRRTFLLLRMEAIDANAPDYANPHALIANEAIRRELRELKTWRPNVAEEEIQKTRQTSVKAGEWSRSQVELKRAHR